MSVRIPLRPLAVTVLIVTALLCGSAAPARADDGPAMPVALGSSLAPTRLIVTFKSSSNVAAVKDTLAAAGADRVGTITLSGAAIVAVPELAASSALAELKADPDVAAARIDPVVDALLTPNDPILAANPGQAWEWQEQNLPAAWDTTTGSASVVVAVIDTGVYAGHEDLAGAVLSGIDLVNGDANAADDYGHGTEVAGTIAARGNNGIGVAGSCWSCKILPVKVLDSNGSGYASTISNGIVWATDHGANIINLSLGGGPDASYTPALNYAVSHGVFVVIAAGNNGSDWPSASFPGGYAIDIPGVVSVGALNYDKVFYNFSNYGSWVELAAPGCAETPTMDGGYASNGVCGTSIASPWVAGEAALALSYDPTLTPAQLEQKIEATADPNLPVGRLLSNGNTVTCAGSGDYHGPCTAYGTIDDKALLQTLGASYDPPALVSAPTLSGTAQVASVLTGSDGSFTGTGGTITLSRAWLRCDATGSNCSPLGGATSSNYTLVPGDEGSMLRFRTTATDSYGQTSANSDASAVVTAAPVIVVAPSLSGEPLLLQGTVTVGGTLTATASAPFYFSGQIDIYAYRWLRCDEQGNACALISAEQTNSYTLTSDDQGFTLKERISATNSAGTASLDSAASAFLPVPPSTDPGPSAPTLSGMPLTIQGEAIIGSTLSIIDQDTRDYFSGEVSSYTSVWLRCDADGSSCSPIAAATLTSYPIVPDDQGHTLKERITATNAGGSVSLNSAVSALVPAPAEPPVDPPVVTPPTNGGGGGNAVPPDLTVALDSGATQIAIDSTVEYHAIVSGLGTGGATGMHLIITLPVGATLVSNQVTRGSGCVQTGNIVDCSLDFFSPPLVAEVRLWVKFTSAGTFSLPFVATSRETDKDSSNNTATATLTVTDPSVIVAPPALAPQLVARPKLVGVARVGQRLAASVGSWQGSGLTYSFSWKRCAANGTHCTTLTTTARFYLLHTADKGKRITVNVTAHNDAGTRKVSSAASATVLAAAKHS